MVQSTSSFLVVDTRTGKEYFGKVNSPNAEDEKIFGIDETDVVVIGNGINKVMLPLAAIAAFPNRTSYDPGWIDCDFDLKEPAPVVDASAES